MKIMIKKIPNRWSVAPLVLLRTSNLPFSDFERLKYGRTIKNFGKRLENNFSHPDWSEREIGDFEVDDRTMKKKILNLIDDQKFWDIHYPFVFKHGPYIFSDKISFSSFPKKKITVDDYKLFYKRILHMTTKHNFSFNFSTCVPGQINPHKLVNIHVPEQIDRGGKKYFWNAGLRRRSKNSLIWRWI